MSSPKLKASERQSILQKLVTTLKKKYGKHEPKSHRPVFETLLYAACLEDAPAAAAEQALQRLLASFYDLNEIRVSSISQIERALDGVNNAAWRALRIRDALHTVFESYYKFDLEHLKRKTHEQALKELSGLKHSTPFMKMYVVQHCLDGHVLPLDASTLNLLVWLGLVDADATVESAAEELKSSVRKPEAGLTCHLLHEFAVDPVFASSLHLSAKDRKAGVDPHAAVERLNELIASGGRKPVKPSRPAAESPKLTKSIRKPVAKPAAKREKKNGQAHPVKKKLTKKPVPSARKRK